MSRSNHAEIQRLAKLILQQQRDQLDTTTDARTLADLCLQVDPEDRPMVDWQGITEAMAPEHRAVISSAVLDQLVHLARFSAYVNDRYLGKTHLSGVDTQNRIARAIRKAFGFSYPSNDIRF